MLRDLDQTAMRLKAQLFDIQQRFSNAVTVLSVSYGVQGSPVSSDYTHLIPIQKP